MKLSNHLTQLGHEVFVLTFELGKRGLSVEGVQYHSSVRLPQYDKVNGIAVLRFPFTCIANRSHGFSLSQAHALEYLSPNILHLQGFFDIGNIVLMCMFAKKRGIPVIITTHGVYETLEKFKEYSMQSIYSRIINLFVSRIIALSEMEKTMLIRFGIEDSKIVVIPNGVDIDIAKEDKIRYSASVGPNAFVLCVARFAPAKNLELLIDAFSGLDTKINLVIAGRIFDQTYFREVQNRVKNQRIRLLTDVSDEELSWLYRNCLFFVLPSLSETSPLSLLEAMAVGKAVVASSVGAIPELVKDRHNGLLFDPRNGFQLRCILAKMLENNELRSEMGRNARSIAESRTWKRSAQSVVEVMTELVQGR